MRKPSNNRMNGADPRTCQHSNGDFRLCHVDVLDLLDQHLDAQNYLQLDRPALSIQQSDDSLL